MPEPKDLRDTSQLSRITSPLPSRRVFYTQVYYGESPHEIHLTLYLDFIDDATLLTDSELTAITNALDELHKTLMIPKGETKCQS